MKLDILDTDYFSTDATASSTLGSLAFSRCAVVSLSAALLILLAARAALWALAARSRSTESNDTGMEKRGGDQPRRWSKYGGIKWEALSPLNLPLSFTLPRRPTRGAAVGLTPALPAPQMAETAPSSRSMAAAQVKRKGSPSGPPVYQSEAPVSMAKIIMSRHTYRRPGTPRPTKRPAAAAPAPSSPATPTLQPPQSSAAPSSSPSADQRGSPADGPQDCMV